MLPGPSLTLKGDRMKFSQVTIGMLASITMFVVGCNTNNGTQDSPTSAIKANAERRIVSMYYIEPGLSETVLPEGLFVRTAVGRAAFNWALKLDKVSLHRISNKENANIKISLGDSNDAPFTVDCSPAIVNCVVKINFLNGDYEGKMKTLYEMWAEILGLKRASHQDSLTPESDFTQEQFQTLATMGYTE